MRDAGTVLESDLVIVSRSPLNAETPLAMQRGLLTSAARHYVRNHFAVPEPPRTVVIDGAVGAPVTLAVDEVRAMAPRTLTVTLECAGNGRRYLDPPAPGEPWSLGAVGTAEWTGVPLRALLERAEVLPDAVEIVFHGADEGEPKDLGRRISFERSLPIGDARREDVLVAWNMNSARLPPEHGAPLRLVVPGWYGMASVKWLARITAVERAFSGFYQSDRYVIDGRPLRTISPRAVITEPADGATVGAGEFLVRGYAWSGRAPVVRVAVSAAREEGSATRRSWGDAALGPAPRYAWREFSFRVPPSDATKGEISLLARAFDETGDAQPLAQVWNALGYGNNAAQAVRVRVAP